MAGFKLTDFRGRRPILDDAQLELTDAQVATNCKIEGGQLGPLKDYSQVAAKTVSGTLTTLYKYNSFWFEWNKDVDVVSALIGDDPDDRRIFTGDGVPQVTSASIATSSQPYPTTSRDLGVPPPGYLYPSKLLGVKPGVTLIGNADDGASVAETRYYVVTCIDEFGAEGPPSPVSDPVIWREGQTVDVTIPAIPTGNYNIQGWNLYRTNTGNTGTDFQFVSSKAASGINFGGVYNDVRLNENLGEVMTTEDYNLPHRSMKGVVEMPGGYLCGFYKNILMFSEPGFPHAWPIKYQLNTKVNIVGLKLVSDNVLLVATEGKPYIAVGSDPYSTGLQELDILQACVSKRSMVDVGNGVVYASPDGLVHITAAGGSALTAGVFTRDQWQSYNPENMEGYYHEGLYYAFNGSGQGFVINPSAPEFGIVDLELEATAGYSDLAGDKLYLAVDGNIVLWEGESTYMDASWVSKQFELARPGSIGVVQVFGNSYPVLVSIVDGDGTVRGSASVSNIKPKRVKGGYKARELEVQLSGFTDYLHEVRIGENMTDMR